MENCFTKCIKHIWLSEKSGREYGPTYSVLKLASLSHSGLDIYPDNPAKEALRRLEGLLDHRTEAQLASLLNDLDNRIQRGVA